MKKFLKRLTGHGTRSSPSRSAQRELDARIGEAPRSQAPGGICSNRAGSPDRPGLAPLPSNDETLRHGGELEDARDVVAEEELGSMEAAIGAEAETSPPLVDEPTSRRLLEGPQAGAGTDSPVRLPSALVSLPEQCLRVCVSFLPVEDTLRIQRVAFEFLRALGIMGPALRARRAIRVQGDATRTLQDEYFEYGTDGETRDDLARRLDSPISNARNGRPPSNSENDNEVGRGRSSVPPQRRRIGIESRLPPARHVAPCGRLPREYGSPSSRRRIPRNPPSIFAIIPVLAVGVRWWWTTPDCRIAYFSQFRSLERLSVSLFEASQFLDHGLQYLLRTNSHTLKQLNIIISPRVSCIDGKDRGPPRRFTDLPPVDEDQLAFLPQVQVMTLMGPFVQAMLLVQDALRLSSDSLTSFAAFCRGETGFAMSDELVRGQVWDSGSLAARPIYQSSMEDQRQTDIMMERCPPILRQLANYTLLSDLSLRLPVALDMKTPATIIDALSNLPRVRSITMSKAHTIRLGQAVIEAQNRGDWLGEAMHGFSNLKSIEVVDPVHFGCDHDDWEGLRAAATSLKQAVIKIQHVVLHHGPSSMSYESLISRQGLSAPTESDASGDRHVDGEAERVAAAEEAFQEKASPPLSMWGRRLSPGSSSSPVLFRSSLHMAVSYFAPSIQTLRLTYYAKAGREFPLTGISFPELKELFIEDLYGNQRNELAGARWPVKHPLAVRMSWIAGEDVSFLPFIQSVPHLDFVMWRERDAEMFVRMAEYIRNRNSDEESMATKKAAIAANAIPALNGGAYKNPNPYLVCPTLTFEFEEIHGQVLHILDHAAPLQKILIAQARACMWQRRAARAARVAAAVAGPRVGHTHARKIVQHTEPAEERPARLVRAVRTSTEMLAEAFVSLRLEQERRRRLGIPAGTNPEASPPCDPFNARWWGCTVRNLTDALTSLAALRLDSLVCCASELLQTCARYFDTEEENRGGLAAMLRLSLCAGDCLLQTRKPSSDRKDLSLRQIYLELAKKKQLRGPLYAEDGSLLEGLLIEDIKLLNLSDRLRRAERIRIQELFGVSQLCTRDYMKKLCNPCCCAKAFDPEGGEFRTREDRIHGRGVGASSRGCTCHYFFCPIIEAHLRLLLKCIPTIKRIWLTYARHHPFATLDAFGLSRRASPILAFFESAGFTAIPSALGEEYEAFQREVAPQVTRFLLARTGPSRSD